MMDTIVKSVLHQSKFLNFWPRKKVLNAMQAPLMANKVIVLQLA